MASWHQAKGQPEAPQPWSTSAQDRWATGLHSCSTGFLCRSRKNPHTVSKTALAYR